MTAEDAVGIYRLLTRAGIGTWVNGGWGVDALVGRQTRPHRDLDLFVERRHAETLRSVLASQGFAEVAGGRAANFVLHDRREREVDVHVFELDAGGDGLYPEESGGTWVCPAEGLQGRGTVLGYEVRCFTAELQVQCHTGYELDAADHHDVALLQELLGVGQDGR